jgi:hypothetical protein
MNITCLNPTCRNQIQINGPWVPAATCTNCGTVHYPPFAQSGAAPAQPPAPVPIPPQGGNNMPSFPPTPPNQGWNPTPTPNQGWNPIPAPPNQGWNPTPAPPNQGWNPTPAPPNRGAAVEPPKPEVQPIATLIAENPFGQRQEFKLKFGTNLIGRATADIQIDIVLTDVSISRPHCVIEVLEHKPNSWKYMVYDISYTNRKESTNGVYIPFRATRLSRVEQVELQVGSYFTAGNIKFELR